MDIFSGLTVATPPSRAGDSLSLPHPPSFSIRVGACVILSFSSGPRTLVLWNFPYVETRLCTHTHICTLIRDPGRKEEGGRMGNKRGWWGRQRNVAFIVIYEGCMYVCMYMA